MSTGKVISFEELKKHNNSKDLWIIIEDKVYDLTNFQIEHPGGEEVLVELAGKNGTKEFRDVQHSEEAKTMMKKYYVGEIEKQESFPVKEIALGVVATVSGFVLVYVIKTLISKK